MSSHRRIGTGLLSLTLIGFFSFAPARAAEVSPFLPNDSQIVWSMNVKQVLDSEVVKKYALEAIKKSIKDNKESQKILEGLGFDPLKDVTAVTGAAVSLDNAKEKMLFVVQGKFDVPKFEALAQAKAKEAQDHLKIHMIGGYKVYEVIEDKETLFVCLLDSSNLVASPSKDMVVDALEKKAGKKKAELNKEMSELLNKADSRIGVSVAILGAALTKVAAGNEKAKASAEKLKSVTGGVTVGADVKLSFVFTAKDADGAKVINQSLDDGIAEAKGILGQIAGFQPKLAPLVTILDTVKVTSKGNDAVLTGEASKELIEKAAKNLNEK